MISTFVCILSEQLNSLNMYFEQSNEGGQGISNVNCLLFFLNFPFQEKCQVYKLWVLLALIPVISLKDGKKLGVKLFEATNKSVSWKEQMSQKTLLEQIANKDEEWESKSDLRRKEKVHLHLFY